MKLLQMYKIKFNSKYIKYWSLMPLGGVARGRGYMSRQLVKTAAGGMFRS